jgi:hypothetical protein
MSFHYSETCTFDNIAIPENSLVLCDIDETVIVFENIDSDWWKRRFEFHYEKNNDYVQADEKSLIDWVDYIQNNKPHATDPGGFNRMIERIEKKRSKLHFITARNKNLENLTKEHIEYLGMSEFGEFPIHHVGVNNCKGKYILDNFDLSFYRNILFIDDLKENIYNVIAQIKPIGIPLHCYLFNLNLNTFH